MTYETIQHADVKVGDKIKLTITHEGEVTEISGNPESSFREARLLTADGRQPWVAIHHAEAAGSRLLERAVPSPLELFQSWPIGTVFTRSDSPSRRIKIGPDLYAFENVNQLPCKATEWLIGYYRIISEVEA